MQRQRLAEKKSIEDKRAEVERLTRELELAIERLCINLQEQKSEDAQDVEPCLRCIKDEENGLVLKRKEDAKERTALSLVQPRYLRLVLQQRTITEENRRLIARYREWQQLVKLLDVDHKRLVAAQTEELLVQKEGGGRWVVFSQDKLTLFYQPLAPKTCLELVWKGYKHMQEVMRGAGARKLYNEAFGWQVCFSTHEDASHQLRMQHRFTKRISANDANGNRVTGDALAKATWEIMQTPNLYAQIYRCPVTSKVLQIVDAHTNVMMRTFFDADAVRKHFVCLVAQVQERVKNETPGTKKSETRRRVTILTSVLDPAMCFSHASTHTLDSMAEWKREGLSYLSFTDDENSVEVEDGGLTNVDRPTALCTGLPFVIMKLGEPLVRWEQLVTSTRTLSVTEQ